MSTRVALWNFFQKQWQARDQRTALPRPKPPTQASLPADAITYTSVHEGGHALAALIRGFTVEKLRLKVHKDGAVEGWCRAVPGAYDPADDVPPELAEHISNDEWRLMIQLAIDCAGEEACRYFFPGDPRNGFHTAGQPRKKNISRDIDLAEKRTAHLSRERAQVLFDLARKSVAADIAAEAPLLLAIAASLRESGKLTHDDILIIGETAGSAAHA